jgi:prepilin-type N-terminal cleavage/methylation domain-containing protein
MSAVDTARVDAARTRARNRGFGLIELIVAMMVIGILASIAVPSMREMSRRMTVTSTNNDIVGALATARAEAAKRGAWVAVIGPGADWSTGWIVQADAATPPNAPNRTFGDPTDVTISHYAAVNNGYSVKTKVTNGNGGNTRIVFGPAGNLVDGTAGTVITADFNVCRPDNNPGQSRWIHVQSSGEIVSHRDTGSSPAPGC